jgi:hypothetical protein
MIQGKLVFRVLMKNKIHLEGCLTDQTVQVGALLMTQLKKWLHHQERSISSLQRYISCYIFEIEREALPRTLRKRELRAPICPGAALKLLPCDHGSWVQVLEISSCRNVGKDFVHKTQSVRTLPRTRRALGCPFFTLSFDCILLELRGRSLSTLFFNCFRLSLFSRTFGKRKPGFARYYATSSRMH